MNGVRNSWYSSTNPALIASAARWGPPTVRSRPADAFICRTASGSKSRSIRVLALETASSVLEYTTLSAACQSFAKSCMTGRWSAKVCAPSQATITSYIRRRPVEVAVLVRDIAVERRDRRVDQLGHREPPIRRHVEPTHPPRHGRQSRGHDTHHGVQPAGPYGSDGSAGHDDDRDQRPC